MSARELTYVLLRATAGLAVAVTVVMVTGMLARSFHAGAAVVSLGAVAVYAAARIAAHFLRPGGAN